MRTFPFTVPTAEGIHALITITQPDSFLLVTTWNDDVTISGETWFAQGAVNITQIVWNADGTASNADIRVASNPAGPIRPGMAARGLLDGLPIDVSLFDPGNLAAGRKSLIGGATIGSVSEDSSGAVIIAVQGRLALMKSPMCEVHTTVCRARLGDSRCRVPLDVPDIGRNSAYIIQDNEQLFTGDKVGAGQSWGRVFQSGSYGDVVYQCVTAGTTASVAPTYTRVVDALQTDGTAVFKCGNAFLVATTGQAIDFFNIQFDTAPATDPSALSNLIPRSGPLKGTKIPVASYDSGTMIITLYEPYALNNFPPGTAFECHPGCDRTLDTCLNTFDNIKNFRGVPYAPNSDLITGRS